MKIINDFTEFVGKKEPILSVIASGLFSLILFYYLYTVARFAKIGIFPFANRITSFKHFDYFVINQQLDNVVLICAFMALIFVLVKQLKLKLLLVGVFSSLFLATLFLNMESGMETLSLLTMPIILGFFIFNKYSSKKILNQNTNLTTKYLIIIGIFIGLLSIISVIFPIFSESSEKPPIRNMMYEIFILLSSVSPILIVILISYYPIKIVLNSVFRLIKKPITLEISELRLGKKSITIWLFLIIAFSIGLYFIPHLESTNPDKQRIAVDTPYYVKWVGSLLESKNLHEFIENAFVLQSGGDRPLTLISIFILSKLNLELENLIEFLPILLGPALIVAVYFFTREITKNDIASLLSAFLTSVSYQTIGGTYAGYYANWLALVLGYASLVFLFKFLKNPTKRLAIVFGCLLIGLLLTHVYTWSIFIVVIIAFLVVQFKLNAHSRKKILFLFLIISTSIIIDVIRFSNTDVLGGLERDYEIGITKGRIDIENFSSRWDSLLSNTAILLGGQIGNVIFLALCLWWLIRSDIYLPRNILLGVFFSIGLIPIILGDWGIQNRLLYDIPFQIPAAITLAQVKIEKKTSNLLILVLIWLISLAIRSLSNFHLISQP